MKTLELKLDAFNKINLFDSPECEEKSWVDNVLEKCHQLHQRIYMEKCKNVKGIVYTNTAFSNVTELQSHIHCLSRWSLSEILIYSLYYPSNSV